MGTGLSLPKNILEENIQFCLSSSPEFLLQFSDVFYRIPVTVKTPGEFLIYVLLKTHKF